MKTSRFMTVFGVVAVLGAATAGPAVAQQRPTQPRDAARPHAMGPAMLIHHREALDLTDEQVQRLEAVREAARERAEAHAERIQAVRARIERAVEGDAFDEAAVRDAFERLGALRTDRRVERLRLRHQVRQVLTPQQREKLESYRAGMRDAMRMRGPMMRGRPGPAPGHRMMHGRMGPGRRGPMMHGPGGRRGEARPMPRRPGGADGTAEAGPGSGA